MKAFPMRLTTPIFFAGSSHNTSPTGTPDPESRNSSPDSVHTNASTEGHIATALQIAKDLLARNVITPDIFERLSRGNEKAQAEIQEKTRQARDWQVRSKDLRAEISELYDNLYETEDQLKVVQPYADNYEAMQEMYIQIQQKNTELVKENAQFKKELLADQQSTGKSSNGKTVATRPSPDPQTAKNNVSLRQRIAYARRPKMATPLKPIHPDESGSLD